MLYVTYLNSMLDKLQKKTIRNKGTTNTIQILLFLSNTKHKANKHGRITHKRKANNTQKENQNLQNKWKSGR